ncbi:hypothetical protein J6590_022257 [Homalodisca vitripennis]|nr:hypothetical protein J6590_022257 [Homalodisca vitripennis]
MAGCSTLSDSEINLVISSDCDDSSECSDVPEPCEVVGGIEDVVRSDHSGCGSEGEPDNDLYQVTQGVEHYTVNLEICGSNPPLTTNDIQSWICDTCKSDDNAANIENLKTKIQDLSLEEDLDLNQSLTLAAELGNALLNENNCLKQQLHETRQEKSQHELKLEENLNIVNEVVKELKDENDNLHNELSSLRNKLEQERALNEDLIKQAEADMTTYSDQIKELSSVNEALKEKNTTPGSNNKLKHSILAQKEELQLLNSSVQNSKHVNGTLELRLMEYDNAIKTYIRTVLDSFKPYLTSDSVSQFKLIHNLQPKCTRSKSQPELSHKTILTCQPESAEWRPEYCNSEELTDARTVKVLQEKSATHMEPLPNTSLTPHTTINRNTGTFRIKHQTARHKKINCLSSPLPHRLTKSPSRKQNLFSVSLQMAKSRDNKEDNTQYNKKQELSLQQQLREQSIGLDKKSDHKFKVTISPPITATKLEPTETIEDFFEKSIKNICSTQMAGLNNTYSQDGSIVILSEHGLKSDQIENVELLPGYCLKSHFSRKHHRKGGVAIFVAENLVEYTEPIDISQHCEELLCEMSLIQIKRNRTHLNILGIYRPPDANIDEALNKLSSAIDTQNRKFPNTYYGGYQYRHSQTEQENDQTK